MTNTSNQKIFVTGGAGFIGAHLVNHLLDTTGDEVTVYDNFKNGRTWAYGNRLSDSRLEVIKADAKDLDALTAAMAGHDVVYHLAANSDIASAAGQPDVDFWEGTYLTQNVVEAMRMTDTKRIFYTSGSGVYGDVDPEPVPEDYPQMIPISTYGASKLAGETLISAYCHMFDLQGSVFRFSNVVGPHQTHGVAYDFMLRLHDEPARLKIYGDGTQTKPYIYIEDILQALDTVKQADQPGFAIYNVATDDHLTVREIADIVVESMGLKEVEYAFTGGTRGWKADVPIYQLDASKLRGLGWEPKRQSRAAVVDAVHAMLEELQNGRLDKRDT